MQAFSSNLSLLQYPFQCQYFQFSIRRKSDLHAWRGVQIARMKWKQNIVENGTTIFSFQLQDSLVCIMWLVSSRRVFFFIWAKWVSGREAAQMDKKGTWFAGSCSPAGRTTSLVIARCWYQNLPHQNFMCQSTKSMDFQKFVHHGKF